MNTPTSSSQPASNFPPCGPDTPHLTARVGLTFPGKPPFVDYEVDLQIRNPSSTPAWLIFGADGQPPRSAYTLQIHARPETPGAQLWHLSGTPIVDMIPVPAHAEFEFRHVRVPTHMGQTSLAFYFVSALAIENVPALDWWRPRHVSASRGEFDMRHLTLLEEKETRPGDDLQPPAPVTFQPLCVHWVSTSERRSP
jgi:hypothetical protein